MSIETHQLYSAALQEMSAKQLAQVLGVGVSHVYKLAADPHSLDVPVRDDIARITAMVEALAARPNGQHALILIRLFFNDLFARVIDRETPKPLSAECIPQHVGRICAEFGDLLSSVGPKFSADQIATEGAQVIAAIECLIRSAEATDDAPAGVRKIGGGR